MAQCKDGTEWLDLTKHRMTYSDPVDTSTYPELEIRNKLAKSKNWQVCKSWLDKKNKAFAYECIINAAETELRTVSFEEACKIMHWKKFTFTCNDRDLKWYPDPEWNEEIDKIAAKLKAEKCNAAANAKSSDETAPAKVVETTYRK